MHALTIIMFPIKKSANAIDDKGCLEFAKDLCHAFKF